MELYVTAIAFFAALLFAAWRSSEDVFVRVAACGHWLCASRFRAAGSIGLFCLLIYGAPSLWRVPTPVVHDEFAYLLQGDTFAHARLTNPPVGLSRFFETFHILQSPTYAAKFPPATGFMLAIGYLLGLPIAGIWLGQAIGCVAVLWMLRGVMPLRWAMLTTLMVAVHPTILWFSQTYWGGGAAMIGGALLGGAVFRVIRQPPDATMGFIAGAGIAVLALSRPFEGAIYSVVAGVALLVISHRQSRWRPILLRFAPAAMVLPILTLGWLMYYDWRITGHPLLMPYALHTSRYMSAPLFFWQAVPVPPIYPNAAMRQFHTMIEYPEYASEVAGLPGFILAALDRGGLIVWAYMRSIVLAVPVLAALLAARSGPRRSAARLSLILCCVVLLIHVSTCPWMRIAYMAPMIGMLFVVVGIGLRQLDGWRWRGEPLGRALVRALVITQIAVGIFSLARGAADNARTGIARRAEIVKSLQQQGGEHLVLVRYDASHVPTEEWVYNPADLTRSPILFARDLGFADDRNLVARYPDRRLWLLDVAAHDASLTPISSAAFLDTRHDDEPASAELPVSNVTPF